MKRANSSDEAARPMRLVAVAVPVPALGPLIYRVPHDIDMPVVGARVLVPLGARQVTGIVVEPDAVRDEVPAGGSAAQIRPLTDVLDRTPFLPEAVVRLALWTAEYYACGAGEAMAAALPPLAGIRSECRARLTAAGTMRKLAAGGTGGRLREVILRALSDERWTSVGALGPQVR